MNTHRHLCSIIGLGLAKQAVEKVKGNLRNLQSSGSVGLLNVWKGLRTLGLGLAKWAQENSWSMSYGSDAVVRLDETRKAREGMREYDIRSELLEDRSVEGLRVNSHLLSVSVACGE